MFCESNIIIGRTTEGKISDDGDDDFHGGDCDGDDDEYWVRW